MSTMLAAVFEGNGVLNVKEVPKPQIMHPDDVLIKVGAASICGSDLHVLHVPPGQYAKPGVILGHEYFQQRLEAFSNSHIKQKQTNADHDYMTACQCRDCLLYTSQQVISKFYH